MEESRKEKRAPAALKVKYKSANVDEFIEQAGVNISRGGIFVKTSKPMPLGVPLRLELQLSSGAPVIRGVGKVAWRREPGQSGDQPAGMGIKFIKLDPGARAVVERAVHERGGGPSRFDSLEGTEAVFMSIPPPAPKPEPVEQPTPAPEEAPDTSEQAPQAPQEHVGDFVASALSEGGAPPVHTEQPSTSWAEALQKRAAVVTKTSRQSESPKPPSSHPPARASESGSHPVSGLFGASSSAERLLRPTSDRPPAEEAVPERTSQSPVQGLFGPSSSSGRIPVAPEEEAEAAAPFPPAAAEDESPTRIWKSPYSFRPPADISTDIPADIPVEMPEPGSGVEERASGEPFGHNASEQVGADEGEGFGAALPPRPAPLLTDLASGSEGGEDAIRPSASDISRAARADMETVPEAALADFASDIPPIAGAEAEPELAPRRRDGVTLPLDTPARRSSLAVSAMAVLALGLLGAGGYLLHMKGVLQLPGIPGPTAELEPPAQETVEPAPEAEPEQVADEQQPQAEEAVGEAEEELAAEAPGAEQAAAPEGESMTFDMAEVEQAAAAEAKAQEPVMTEVAFQSNPPGATIFIDEELAGKTPFKLSLEAGKPVNVSAKSPGFKKETRQLVPAATGQKPVRFQLVKLSYVLVVKTDPPGANVTVGNKTAVSPEPLDLGQLVAPVTATLSKTGFQRVAIPVRRGQFEETDDAFLYATDMKLTPLPDAVAPKRPPKKRRPVRRAFKPKAKAPSPAKPPAEKEPAKAEPAPAPEKEEKPAPEPPAPAKPPKPEEEKIPDNPFY